MPVTYKIEDKVKKSPGAEPIPNLSDYALAEERKEGTKAFWTWIAIILVLSAVLAIIPPTRPFGIAIFVWWLATVFIYFVLAPYLLLRRLRQMGPEHALNAKTQPRLNAILSKGSGLIDIPQPEGFWIDEGNSQVRILGRRHPYFMIITKAATQVLQPAELDCLTLRALMHARQNHVRRLMLLNFLNDTPSIARFLVWPVALYGTLLRNGWQELAEQSTDRLTLLLVKNHKLMTGALLKQHIVGDPFMQESNVSVEDVDNYLNQGRIIGMAGAEISIQYKMGQAIHENPYLEERIQALKNWAGSSNYAAAVEKLAAARAGKMADVTKNPSE